MRKTIVAATLAALLLPAAPALADGPHHHHHSKYDRHGRYSEPHEVRRDRTWRGKDGRYYCKRDNGTTGLVIGAAAGALVGREMDGGRDRMTGTILGAAAGGLLGREIDKGPVKCR
jgi:hypothetical protein